jgi:hypothetical protein
MKKLFALFALAVMAVGTSFAQVAPTSPTTDVLGAHLVYGRGCAACHVPHSGTNGNGKAQQKAGNNGVEALWGQDMSPLYNQVLQFGDGASYSVTLPDYSTATGSAPTSAHDPLFGIIACLSCHDGNLTSAAFMKGTTYETVTINGFAFNPPTLLGKDGTYHNDHPVGPAATVACGGQYNWDCTFAAGTYTLGANGTIFAANYLDPTKGGGVLKSTVNGGNAAGNYVTCTTCHDQHSMTDFVGYVGTATTPTHFTTSFFVRGWYQPGLTANSNNAAQFCRQCHGGEANEMHNNFSTGTN